MKKTTVDPTAQKQQLKLQLIRLAPWCHSWRKRAFDIVAATGLLLPGVPIISLVSVLMRIGSRGPALLRQNRVGIDGKEFQMYKLRTMKHTDSNGSALTRTGDPRVTALGRLVRKWKLDELPQLFNVLQGHMSLVGPRPHLPRLLHVSTEQKQFLTLRPGITGLATLYFRNEEEILPNLPAEQLESFYVRTILPEKIQLELKYARNATFWSDITLLFRTCHALLSRYDIEGWSRLQKQARLQSAGRPLSIAQSRQEPNSGN